MSVWELRVVVAAEEYDVAVEFYPSKKVVTKRAAKAGGMLEVNEVE